MISDNKKISIIMNCYNGQKYLVESLKSIFTQTYKNWELIFWDNLSEDKSKEIIKSFKDERIKYYKSNKFLNLYEARNEAIKKSRGEYITFLDTDDYWSKDKLEKQIDFFYKNKQIKVVYSNYHTINQIKNKKYLTNKDLPQGNITKSLLNNYVIGILTVCIDRSIFDKNMFNEKFNIIGDFDFFMNLSKSYKIGCIQESLACYRVHKNNYSRIKLKTYIDELKDWINENIKDYEKDGYNLNKQKYELIKLKVKFFLASLGV